MYEYGFKKRLNIIIRKCRIAFVICYHFPNASSFFGKQRTVEAFNIRTVQSYSDGISRVVSIFFSDLFLADNAYDIQEYIFQIVHIFIRNVYSSIRHKFEEYIHFGPFALVLAFNL